MDDGHIVVDSIAPIRASRLAVNRDCERYDLLRIARHGRGDKVYLIRFHYLPPGAWH